jgi:hypothetical protein
VYTECTTVNVITPVVRPITHLDTKPTIQPATIATPTFSLPPDYIDSIPVGIELDWVIARDRMGTIGQSVPRYSTNTHHAMLITFAYPELNFHMMKLADGMFNASFFRDGEQPVWACATSPAHAICKAILLANVGMATTTI